MDGRMMVTVSYEVPISDISMDMYEEDKNNGFEMARHDVQIDMDLVQSALGFENVVIEKVEIKLDDMEG